MEYRLLGSLQIRQCGDRRWRRVDGRAQRRLISRLALHAGHVVGSDVLEEDLDMSAGAVRTAVSRLRHVVDDDSVRTVPPGYLLEAADTDVDRFEWLVVRSSRLHRFEAARFLDAALELWRGRPYDEFADEAWAIAEVARLSEMQREAREQLADLWLVDGKHAAAMTLIEQLLAEDPYRDRARALLIRAHALSGHPIEALHAFREYESQLAVEIGATPSAELAALDRSITLALAAENGDVTPAVEAVEVIAAALADGPARGFAAQLVDAAEAERRRCPRR